MKKVFQKIGMCVLAFVMILGAGLTLSACNKGEQQVMSLSVNPSVEFVLDENDKVLSVTANNEDGVYILQKFSDFTGMTAQDAALKFLELCETYGFVVEGSTDGETFTISVSGEGAKAVYNNVKNKINEKATQLGLAIDEMVEIGKAELQNLVAECYQEYSNAEIAHLSEDELINLIKQSREETKNLFTENEKIDYYKERARVVLQAKIDAINAYLEENASLANVIIEPIVETMNTTLSQIQTSYQNLETQLEAAFSEVNTNLNNYIAEKKEYLDAAKAYNEALAANAENVEELKTVMENLKAQAETYWTTLESDREEFKTQILSFIKTTIQNQIALLNTQIESILEHINLKAAEIQKEVQSQIESLKTQFEELSTNPWAA